MAKIKIKQFVFGSGVSLLESFGYYEEMSRKNEETGRNNVKMGRKDDESGRKNVKSGRKMWKQAENTRKQTGKMWK